MHSSISLSRLANLVIAALAVILIAATSSAGEFFEKDGAALSGYDVVAYFSDKKPLKGSAEYTTDYKGSTFYFATRSNRDVFVAEPAKFAPQYGGFCAFGTAGGYKAAIDPAAFTIVDGKLYLNYNHDVQEQWGADIPGYIAKADKNWPEVSSQTKVVE